MSDPRWYQVETQAANWLYDEANWQSWEKEVSWWRKLRARLFVKPIKGVSRSVRRSVL